MAGQILPIMLRRFFLPGFLVLQSIYLAHIIACNGESYDALQASPQKVSETLRHAMPSGLIREQAQMSTSMHIFLRHTCQHQPSPILGERLTSPAAR